MGSVTNIQTTGDASIYTATDAGHPSIDGHRYIGERLAGEIVKLNGIDAFNTVGSSTMEFPSFAPLASPAFTGNPTAPTPTLGDNDTSIATTAFVLGAVTANIAQSITNGVTTTAPSQDAVYDALVNKVDVVAGSRLITSSEATDIGYLSGVASNVQNQLNAKVNLNTLITPSTGTKVTYDAKGLILSSTNITTSDVSGLGTLATQNGTFSGTSSGTNTGDQTYLDARVQSVTSSATVTPTSANDLVIITAQAVGLTLANPTGTFTEGQALMIRIKDNGTARGITFDTNYRAIGITLPTTTVISKTIYLGIIYNSTDAKFDVIGLNQQA